MTPAQAAGVPSFITDVPVQGPTDQGQREKTCLWTQQRLFPWISGGSMSAERTGVGGCVGPAARGGCDGAIPNWTSNSFCPANLGPSSGYVAGISFGGVGVPGYALSGASDPEIFSKLSTEQQTWVGAALSKLNDHIVATTGTTCPGWGPAIGPASTCFQGWYNTNYAHPAGPANPLRTDGVFDEDTLCALLGITSSFASDFPTAFPDPSKQHCQSGTTPPVAVPAPAAATPAAAAPTAAGATPAATAITPPAAKPPLSKGMKIGIGVAGATALGGILWATTKKKK